MMDNYTTVIAGVPGSHIEYHCSKGLGSDEPTGFVIIITRIGSKWSEPYDIIDTEINDEFAFPVCGPAGGSHTITMQTTLWAGLKGPMELLCPKEKKSRTK